MSSMLDVKNPVLKNKDHYLTSDYKTRNPGRPTHNGMDLIGMNRGLDYIIAIDSGVVSKTGYDSAMGYYVNIYHGECTSVYFHMKKDSIRVRAGDFLNKGDIIGYMGSTGRSTGPHLHFGIKTTSYIDPKPYLLTDNIFYKNRVKALQTSLNNSYNSKLVVDGIIGTMTTLAIKNNPIKLGSKNNFVKFVQQQLYRVGYPIAVDGNFGTNTENAVKKFQTRVGISSDGIVGIDTVKKLVNM